MNMKRLIEFLLPPPQWRIPVLLVLAILTGTLGYLAVAGKALSYLSDSPETCINCHIMLPQYATWKHSSHRNVTSCNDCHVPQSFFRKYFFKAKDGLRHSVLFTLKMERNVILIEPSSAQVVQENCIRCHHSQWNSNPVNSFHQASTGTKCWDCHREVPHGKVRSLSATPFSRTELKP